MSEKPPTPSGLERCDVRKGAARCLALKGHVKRGEGPCYFDDAPLADVAEELLLVLDSVRDMEMPLEDAGRIARAKLDLTKAIALVRGQHMGQPSCTCPSTSSAPCECRTAGAAQERARCLRFLAGPWGHDDITDFAGVISRGIEIGGEPPTMKQPTEQPSVSASGAVTGAGAVISEAASEAWPDRKDEPRPGGGSRYTHPEQPPSDATVPARAADGRFICGTCFGSGAGGGPKGARGWCKSCGGDGTVHDEAKAHRHTANVTDATTTRIGPTLDEVLHGAGFERSDFPELRMADGKDTNDCDDPNCVMNEALQGSECRRPEHRRAKPPAFGALLFLLDEAARMLRQVDVDGSEAWLATYASECTPHVSPEEKK